METRELVIGDHVRFIGLWANWPEGVEGQEIRGVVQESTTNNASILLIAWIAPVVLSGSWDTCCRHDLELIVPYQSLPPSVRVISLQGD